MGLIDEKLRAAEQRSGVSLRPQTTPAARPAQVPGRPAPYGQQRGGYGAARQVEPARSLPADYVEVAERFWSSDMDPRQMTTSKLRSILSLLTNVYNVESIRSETALTQESIYRLQLARVRMIYECGRDFKVKDFITKSGLIAYLKNVGDNREKAVHYFHYMEALVAYHRFFGGKNG